MTIGAAFAFDILVHGPRSVAQELNEFLHRDSAQGGEVDVEPAVWVMDSKAEATIALALDREGGTKVSLEGMCAMQAKLLALSGEIDRLITVYDFLNVFHGKGRRHVLSFGIEAKQSILGIARESRHVLDPVAVLEDDDHDPSPSIEVDQQRLL